MFSVIKARCAERHEDEQGFTLIELMVVVLIIAILIAIAIPTFLGARQKAQDRAAQSDLRNALTAAKTAYVDTQDYTVAAPQLQSVEPSLQFNLASNSDAPGHIAVKATVPSDIGLASLAADGTCWQLYDSTTGTAGTTYGHISNATSATCAAPTAALGANW